MILYCQQHTATSSVAVISVDGVVWGKNLIIKNEVFKPGFSYTQNVRVINMYKGLKRHQLVADTSSIPKIARKCATFMLSRYFIIVVVVG